MATAFRVNSPAIASAAVPAGMGAVGCIAAGAFGKRVAGLLAAALPSTREPAGPADAFSSGTGPVVVALWRPSPALCEQVDALAFESRRPWLPVIMEHPVMRIGPRVSPPAGPCFACYQARRAQHDERRGSTELLHAAYDRDASCGPAGFLPQHARTAAAIAWAMLAEDTCDGETGGQVVTVRLTTLGVSAHRVVPVHGCARCSASAPPRDLRTLLRLGRAEAGR